MKILLTGASGLLGSNLAYSWRRHEILGLYHTHEWQLDGIVTKKADLLSPGDVKAAVEEFAPDVIVHSAAIADVDQCEVDCGLAYQTNVVATKNLIAAAGQESKVIYISTDLVFDGIKGQYRESDPVHPINVYGKTKYEGEGEALRHRNTMVARTNFFGWNVQDKLSLAEWVVHELSQKKRIKGFTDAVFCGIYTLELARVLEAAIERDLRGVYHCVSGDAMSKYDFACLLASLFHLPRDLIAPASIEDFPFKAKRAKNLWLNTDKLRGALGQSLPTMKESLEAFKRDARDGVANGLNVCSAKRNRFCVPAFYGKDV